MEVAIVGSGMAGGDDAAAVAASLGGLEG